MNCHNCRFWNDRNNECRRHAPLYREHGHSLDGHNHRKWPMTDRDDWCGDHAPTVAIEPEYPEEPKQPKQPKQPPPKCPPHRWVNRVTGGAICEDCGAIVKV